MTANEALDQAAAILVESATRILGAKKRVNMIDAHTAWVLQSHAEKILALKESYGGTIQTAPEPQRRYKPEHNGESNPGRCIR